MPEHAPRRLVTFARPDGKGYAQANLDECRHWVQTRLVGTIYDEAWERYQADPDAWEGEPPRCPIATSDTHAFHGGNVEPTLYRSPQGDWFRRLSWDEYPKGALEPEGRRFYVGLTEGQAHDWLRLNEYDLPTPVPVPTKVDSEFQDDLRGFPAVGAPLTVALFGRLLRDVEQLHELAGFKGREWSGVYPPAIHQAIAHREYLKIKAPGFKALETYLNVELEQYVTKKAIEDFVKCLARKLRKPFDEVARLTIEEALAVLNEPAETAASAKPHENIAPSTVRAEPKYTRGELDSHAAILQAKNPAHTFAQLATTLGCNASTLRDRKKCPLLAEARKRIKAEKLVYRKGDAWRDRRSDDE